jgi:hypothetical protein
VDPMNPSVNPDITAFIVEKYKDTKEALHVISPDGVGGHPDAGRSDLDSLGCRPQGI